MKKHVTDDEIKRLIKKREDENEVFKKLLERLEALSDGMNKKRLKNFKNK